MSIEGFVNKDLKFIQDVTVIVSLILVYFIIVKLFTFVTTKYYLDYIEQPLSSQNTQTTTTTTTTRRTTIKTNGYHSRHRFE